MAVAGTTDLGLNAGVAKQSEVVVTFTLPATAATLGVSINGSEALACTIEFTPPADASKAYDVPVTCGGYKDTLTLVPGEVSVELGNVTAGAQDAKALTDGYAAVATSEVEQKAQLKKMGALTAVAIALHNFPEGLATFLATVDNISSGVGLGIAIAIHNVPEGLCVAMPIFYATGNKWKAFGWSLLSGVTEPIGGILGYAVLQPVFTPLVYGIVFSMVGGMMVFIVLHELLPTAHRYMGSQWKATAWLVIGMVIMALSLVLFNL